MDPQPALLLPRYRRPLTFGAILDETIRIYRQAWRTTVAIVLLATFLAAVSAAVVVGVAAVVGGTQLFARVANPAALRAGGATGALAFAAAVIGGILVAGVVAGSFLFSANAAISLLAERHLRGQPAQFGRLFRDGLGRALPLLGSTVIYVLALGLLSLLGLAPLVAAAAFLSGLTGLVLTLLAWLAAAAGLLIWAVRPAWRSPWLKWAIVLLSPPIGLPGYFGMRWALWAQAVALEHQGPIGALRRSGYLATGQWFRVSGILTVIGLITSILQSIPGFLVGSAFVIVGGSSASTLNGLGLAADAANIAGSVLGWFLFGSVSFIASTLLFVDLRNRRDGADLLERVALLEAATP